MQAPMLCSSLKQVTRPHTLGRVLPSSRVVVSVSGSMVLRRATDQNSLRIEPSSFLFAVPSRRNANTRRYFGSAARAAESDKYH